MMQFSRKPLITIATIFITVLVSFAIVRLTGLSVEWQGIAIALLTAALFFVFQYLIHYQRPQQPSIVIADATRQLFDKLQKELGTQEAKYFVYQPSADGFAGVNCRGFMNRSHPLLFTLSKQSDKDIPDIYVDDIQHLLEQYGQHTYAITTAQIDHPLGIVFVTNKLTDTQVSLLRDFGTLLYLNLRQQFQNSDGQKSDVVSKKSQMMSYLIIGLFVLFTAWFVWNDYLMSVGVTEVSNVYGVVALVGAIYGFKVSARWKHLPNLASALRWLAIGVLCQMLGQVSYTYYAEVLNIETPYPSFGDIGFFGSVIAYLAASIYLAKSYGLKLRAIGRKEYGQFFSTLLVIYIVAYILFFREYTVDFTHPLKLFLDFGYPGLQGVYVAIAFVTYLRAKTAQSTLGKKTLFFLFVLAWQFFCDYMFIYQAYYETWHPNGLNDYFYFLSYVFVNILFVVFSKKELRGRKT